LAHIADININNIQETLRQVSAETLNQSVAAIISAQRIRVFASGMSAAAAVATESSLTMLGFPVRAIVNGGLSQTLEISKLNNRDVVILISVWRYLRDTIDAANHAHAVGATTIALTDSSVSPVARSADYVFVATMESAAHSRSLTGIISLIDLINATIISKHPEQSMQALKKIDDLYHDQGKLLGD
jgi:DNA-binding MurR/RpiR family transcriptional regulator